MEYFIKKKGGASVIGGIFKIITRSVEGLAIEGAKTRDSKYEKNLTPLVGGIGGWFTFNIVV